MQILGGTLEEMQQKAAELMVCAIEKEISEKGAAVIAIPGGRSVTKIFEILKTIQTDWNKVQIFLVDERLVPINHADSNFKQINESFICEFVSLGKMPRENVHPFNFTGNLSADLSSYKKELEKYGGKFDIILLGAGEDGHVGALFPNHETILSNEEYFVTTKTSPKPPAERMSASQKLLLKSKTAIVLFFGEGKRNAFANFKDKRLSVNDCPAKIVQSIQNSFVITDLK